LKSILDISKVEAGKMELNYKKFVQIMYDLLDSTVKFSYEDSQVIIGARKKGELVELTGVLNEKYEPPFYYIFYVSVHSFVLDF
jgi:hypothetical protein